MKLAMGMTRGLVGCAGVACGLLATMAAASPPVLDKVPSNAMAVIATPSVAQLQKNLGSLATAVDSPIPMPGVEDLLAQLGIEKGIDTSKSIAMVILGPANGGKNANGKPMNEAELKAAMEKNLFVLVPTANYNEFVGNFDVKPGAGVDSGKIDGDETYFKNIGGGYAAMSPSKSVLEAFEGKGGNQAAMDASLGKSGKAVADSSDIFIVLNMDVARAFQPMIMDKVKEGMEGNPAGLALEGMGEGELGQWVETMSKDAQTLIIGMKPDAMGFSVDLAMSFRTGSAMATAFSGTGNTAPLISKLPNQPYFFAGAIDFSSPGLRKLWDDFSKKAAAAGGEAGLADVPMEQIRNSDGASFLVGAPQGGIMGGMLTSTIGYFRTAKPAEAIESMKKALADLNGKDAGPVKLQTTFESGGAEVDGTAVDSYSIKFSPADDEEADPQVGMATQIIFGAAGGPGGYISKQDNGMLMSLSKNSLLMSAAMKAAKGGESVGSDKLTAQVSEHLPKNRMFEFYIGVKPIMEAVLPLAAMGGVNLEIDLPPTMPPIGVGMSAGDGAAHLGMYMPAPVLKTLIGAAMQAQGMGGGGGDPAGGGGKKPAGSKPRF